MDLYDNAINVERTMRERNNYFNKKHRINRKGDQREGFHPQGLYRRPPKNPCTNNNARGG